MPKPVKFRLGSKAKKSSDPIDKTEEAKIEEAPFLAPTQQKDDQEPSVNQDPSAAQPTEISPAPEVLPQPTIHQPTAQEIFHPDPDTQPASQLLQEATTAEAFSEAAPSTDNQSEPPDVHPFPHGNEADQDQAESIADTQTNNQDSEPADNLAETAEPAARPGLKTAHELTTDQLNAEQLRPQTPKTAPAILGAALSLSLLVGLGVVWYNLNQNVYTLGLGNPHAPTTKATPASNKPKTLGAETSAPRHLNLTLNLKPLTQGHYQAWLNQNNQTTSLGSFNAQAAGPLKNLDGSTFSPTITLSDPNATLLITVEAGNSDVQSPSKSVILTGKLNDGQNTLTFPAGNLKQASGVFTLATPTDPSGPNQKSGIWFAHTDGKTLISPGLKLPEAPAGWKYEAQAIYKGVSVEIGRFSKADESDEFNKFAVNQDQVPPFPGEDFLQKSPSFLGIDFPTDLTTGDWQVLISIEPDQNGTDPTGDDTFFIQPFKADIPQGADTYKEYPLTLDLTTLPSGTAELQ